MKKRAFTLIELLAVIVILAVIALIATPIVLNVVDNAQKKADLGSANGLIDAGRLYYSESLLDDNKKEKLENYENLWNDIVIQGEKPKEGFLYVNPEGKVALSVIYRHTCYQKEFQAGLEILKESDCGLGFVGTDTKAPDVTFTVLGNPFNEFDWAKDDFYVRVEVIDQESGPKSYKWCTTKNDTCNPEAEYPSSTGSVLISEEASTNRVCVIGIDRSGNKSEIICSDPYKLDKTRPSLNGIGDIAIRKDQSVDLISGVTWIDGLSGVDGTFTYTPMSVDTSKAGTTNITYIVKDQAGNSQEYLRKIIVETEAPLLTFDAEPGKINAYGWAKNNFLVTITPIDQSGHGIKEFKWCSTTSSSCDPSGNAAQTTPKGAVTISTESASNRICVIVTDNTGKTSPNICSDTYKLDKTAPVAGTLNVTGTMGSNNWYTSNVTLTTNNGSDSLSGHESTSISTSSITSDVTNQIVTITTQDKAGNSGVRQQYVSIDKNSPTITAKNSDVSITAGDDNNILNSYFTYGNVGPSSIVSTSCIQGGNPITTTGSLSTGTYTISCSTTKANGKSATASINLIVQGKKYLYFTNYRAKGDDGVSSTGVYISRCDSDGNNCVTLPKTAIWSATDYNINPVISANNNYLYVTNYRAKGDDGVSSTGVYISRCDLSGNNCATLPKTAISRVTNYNINPVISANNNYLYFTNYRAKGDDGVSSTGVYISRCDLSGNNCVTLPKTAIWGTADYNINPVISANNNYLYITNYRAKGDDGVSSTGVYVSRCDLSGNNCVTLPKTAIWRTNDYNINPVISANQ